MLITGTKKKEPKSKKHSNSSHTTTQGWIDHIINGCDHKEDSVDQVHICLLRKIMESLRHCVNLEVHVVCIYHAGYAKLHSY